MPKFRKKPVVIDAEQFSASRTPWPKGVYAWWLDHGDNERQSFDSAPLVRHQMRIDTLEGFHIVSEGDWIITGVKGERYPCKPDIFAMTYEAVP